MKAMKAMEAMNRRLIFLVVMIFSTFFSSGCIQEHLVIPVAAVAGKVIVPAGQIPLGVRITVAGNPGKKTFVNEYGEYKLEFEKSGRYLLVARGRDFDAEYMWVDAVLEETVKPQNFSLDSKLVGEAEWLATIVDYPDATGFSIKSNDPVWASSPVRMYDDGTHGDKLANDGIYTLRLSNLKTGSQLYKLVWHQDTNSKEVRDPHEEDTRRSQSEIIIREPSSKLARGTVTSALVGVNYSEVVLQTKAGARKMFVDSDGAYAIAMEGNAKEYLVFRSQNFHIRAIPVDLTTVPVFDVPPVTLQAKGAQEARFMLIKSDFQNVTNPMVVADFTNWQPQALYDDGTNGDEVAGDGVYTRVFTNVAPGYHKYAFNLSDGNQVRDPYQESGDSQYSILLVK